MLIVSKLLWEYRWFTAIVFEDGVLNMMTSEIYSIEPSQKNYFFNIA